MKTQIVYLTDAELVLLDGKCSEENQAKVIAAKERLALIASMPDVEPNIAVFVSKVVQNALEPRTIIYRKMGISDCDVCGKKGGYWPHQRSSRYHRKGEPNYKAPRLIDGVDLVHHFISIQHRPNLGCCAACFEKAKPVLIAELAKVDAEVSPVITGEDPRFYVLDENKCSKCGWVGGDHQMRPRPRMMDNSSYAAGCPNCPAENTLFSTVIKKERSILVKAEDVPEWLKPRKKIAA